MYCGDTVKGEMNPEKRRVFNDGALCLRMLLNLLFALRAQDKSAKPVQKTDV